jgi:hypothetical protein
VPAAVKQRLRDQYRTLNPVALLADIRTAQEELGNRIDRRAGNARCQPRVDDGTVPQRMQSSTPDAAAFARTLGTTIEARDPRATHRRPKRTYKKRIRMPSKLDQHVANGRARRRPGAFVDGSGRRETIRRGEEEEVGLLAA